MQLSQKLQAQAFSAAYAAVIAVTSDTKAAYSAGEDAVRDLELFLSEREFVKAQETTQAVAAFEVQNPISFVMASNKHDGGTIADMRTGRRFRIVELQPDGTGLMDCGRVISAEDMKKAKTVPITIEQKFKLPMRAYVVGGEFVKVQGIKQLRTGDDLELRDLGTANG